MNTIISVENLSKKFRIRHQTELPYKTLSDELKHLFRKRINYEEFYALQGITFRIKEGESVGIIGKNGSGKSTLLKILSRVTPPTSGIVKYRGRLASLLEVGTGFHPELTGRENIFLNGSIMGMKRKEIQRNFDAIVEFSGVEKFLDTPLKHFSSGMQLRLAFSVAAHLEPEILVIDEVLAVGDAEFQKKCMGKMETVSKSGRSILFVSHNLSAVQSLCSQCMLLINGQLAAFGNTAEVIDRYIESSGLLGNNHQTEKVIIDQSAHAGRILKSIQIRQEHNNSGKLFPGLRTEIIIGCATPETIASPVVGLVIKNHLDTPLIVINNKHYGTLFTSFKGRASFRIVFEKLPLPAGRYKAAIYFGNGLTDIDKAEDALIFHVDHKDYSGQGFLITDNLIFAPDVAWQFSPDNE